MRFIARMPPAPPLFQTNHRQDDGADENARKYGVEIVGRAEDVAVKYYAISVERRLTHPAVLAITQAAKQALFVDATLAKPLQA